MTLQEAIKSGKRFKRPNWPEWYAPYAGSRLLLDESSIFADDYEVYAEKNRYWLWDIREKNGAVFKCETYMDCNMLKPNGKTMNLPHGWTLFKKHENEYIEV